MMAASQQVKEPPLSFCIRKRIREWEKAGIPEGSVAENDPEKLSLVNSSLTCLLCASVYACARVYIQSEVMHKMGRG